MFSKNPEIEPRINDLKRALLGLIAFPLALLASSATIPNGDGDVRAPELAWGQRQAIRCMNDPHYTTRYYQVEPRVAVPAQDPVPWGWERAEPAPRTAPLPPVVYVQVPDFYTQSVACSPRLINQAWTHERSIRKMPDWSLEAQEEALGERPATELSQGETSTD